MFYFSLGCKFIQIYINEIWMKSYFLTFKKLNHGRWRLGRGAPATPGLPSFSSSSCSSVRKTEQVVCLFFSQRQVFILLCTGGVVYCARWLAASNADGWLDARRRMPGWRRAFGTVCSSVFWGEVVLSRFRISGGPWCVRSA
jgi:hypothetical protein